jgi:hypothetical protein
MKRIGCGSVGQFLFILLFLLVGVSALLPGVNTLRNARISKEWPTTSGTITFSQVAISTDEDGTTYYADVRFKYVVNDRWYTADTVHFGEYSSGSGRAEEIVARYPPESRVTVYYNPDSPQTAVLEPGVTIGAYLTILVALSFFIVPGIIIFVGIRNQQSNQ